MVVFIKYTRTINGLHDSRDYCNVTIQWSRNRKGTLRMQWPFLTN